MQAGVLFGGTGNDGADLSENGGSMLLVLDVDFDVMTTPTLVIGGQGHR